MHTRTALLTLMLALAAAAGPAVSVVGAADVTLTVSVETAGGSPVGDADLIASWEGGSVTRTTASNGKAFIDVPQGSDVTIEVDHPDYIRNSPVRVTDARAEDVAITVYEKASATLTVVDSNGPVEGVRVDFRKRGEIAATRTTDSQGEVESGVIEAGEYDVLLFKSGYHRERVALDVQGDVTEQLQVEQGSVTVRFLVLDDNFDPPAPVAEATISGSDFSTASQADGTRSVSLPVNSQVSVSVEKSGYETVQQAVIVREQDKQVNITTRKLPAVVVDVPNERVVVGEALQVTVTDQYGDPLPEAVVYLDGDPVGQPDAQGVVRVPMEASGDHTLHAEFDQLSSDTLTITGVSAGGGVTSPDGNEVTTPDDGDSSGDTIDVPGVGPVQIRSVAFGIAGGLVLAVVMFVYVRVR